VTTTYVVPCGVSVLDGLRDPKRPRPEGGRPYPFLTAEKAARPGLRGALAGEVVARWVDQVGADADTAKLGGWPALVCAETTTLSVHTGLPTPSRLLDRGDRVLLLASDSDEGIAAALCVAYLIAGGKSARICCVDTPADDDAAVTFGRSLAVGKVTIVRVTGLEPDQLNMHRAVAGIGRTLLAVHDLGDPIEVHLTGGYKVTLLHTLTMTELLYSRAPDRVSAWYVFEGTEDKKPAMVRMGLRLFMDKHLKGMREELSGVVQKVETRGPYLFERVAWERLDDGTRVLTEFGVGHLAVLGGSLPTHAFGSGT
jgi:hypothetical protein